MEQAFQMPLNYPNSIQFADLESTRPGYQEESEFLSKIDLLFRGGQVMESHKKHFLMKRLDESPEEYKLRLDRFVYSPLLSNNVQKILSKFSTGQIHVSGIEGDTDWASFRECLDLNKSDEKTFVVDCLRDLLVYRQIYIQVDKPYDDFNPVNRLQERQLGALPYLIRYTPQEVINEAVDGSWYKIRTLNIVNRLLGPSLYKLCWTLVDDNAVAKYSCFCELNKKGQIAKIVDPQTGKTTPPLDETPIYLESLVEHNFSVCPIVKLSLPEEKYTAGQAYLKLLQYLNLENAVTDTAISAGYVQRVFTPLATPENDYEIVTEDNFISSNAYVLKGQKFSYEEIKGTSIKTVSELMETIRGDILDIICLSAGSTNKESLTRAAASKKMDNSVFEIALQAYGSLISSFYQDVLGVVSEILPVSAPLSVSGLDSFETDTLATDIDTAAKILKEGLEDKLSPYAVKTFFNRISLRLNPNSTAQEKSEILAELEAK